MSITSYCDLQCDGEDCAANGTFDDPQQASNWAFLNGWVVKGDKHYCPRCVKKGRGDGEGSSACRP